MRETSPQVFQAVLSLFGENGKLVLNKRCLYLRTPIIRVNIPHRYVTGRKSINATQNYIDPLTLLDITVFHLYYFCIIQTVKRHIYIYFH